MAVDLDAYFRRIGYAGERTPTFDTLRAISRLHPQAIAFENLNPFMKWPVNLDLPSLEQKMVRDGRGGYCFEQNLLLSHVLKALGFQVRELAGRVVWNLPENAMTPQTHMLLQVDLDEQDYIVDVGFGLGTLTAPLRLQVNIEQSTPHEPCRLIKAGEDFVLRTKIGEKWVALYRFNLQEQFLSDHEIRNWYTSTHPRSRFVTELMAARTDTDCRYTLRNNTLTVRNVNGITERHSLGSSADVRTTLEGVFRLTLPNAQDLDAALDRAIRQSG
jgi:N-hydroxyarylamine O-acetyltransferase